MALRLFNTLTRKQDELFPLEEGHVRMYTCGPTVYDYAHIGNLRTFVFQDLLRRQIMFLGYRLTHVMNITDVDDKIIAGAEAQGVPLETYTPRFISAFLQDLKTLRVQRPEIIPRATDHIPEMVDLIRALKEKGLTYEKEGSVYFRVASFSDYGKLSGLDLPAADASGRLDDNDHDKENPRDFVLWKARKPGEVWWDSPFGPGRPGWHVECSAMSMKYLGPSFDIHCGGVDLVFPHHENEIAQSEGATGHPFVKYWVHASHLIVEGEKMSKSRGNFFTLQDILDRGYSAEAVRYLLASVHYRRQLNFTFAGLDQARASLQRVNDFLQRLREIPDGRGSTSDLDARVDKARRSFEEGLNNDINTSEALASVFDLVRDVNTHLDHEDLSSPDRDQILAFFSQVNQILDVFQVEEQALQDEKVAELISRRTELRRRRQYAQADEVRQELEARGILLEDTKEGTRWKRAN